MSTNINKTDKRTRILLLSSLFTYNFSASVYSNTLPLIIISLGLGAIEVSISSFIINLVFISLASYAGGLGDRTGARRGIMILGSLFLTLSELLVVTMYSYPSVLFSSALSGIASALFSSNAVMAVVELGLTSGEKRPEVSLAHAGLASGSGWFSGLLLGGALVKVLGLRNALLASVPMVILTMFLIYFSQGPLLGLEREVLAKPHIVFLGVVERIRILFTYIPRIKNPIRTTRTILYDPFRSYLAAVMTAFLAISIFFTQIPVFMRKALHVPSDEVMILMSVHNGVSTVAFVLLSFRIIEVRPEKALQLALGLRSLAFTLPLLSLSVSYRLVFPLTFLITGATWAFINVSMNSIALSLGGALRGGERIGQLNGAISLGILIGSLMSGVLVSLLGFVSNFLIASSIIMFSLIWIRRLLH